MHKQRIAVIGGVASGTAAAAEARRADPDAAVVLFEKGKHISYGACEIPLFLGGVVSTPEQLIAFTPERFASDRKVDVRINSRVERFDSVSGELVVSNTETGIANVQKFDKFILATGAIARRPDILGVDADNVFVIRELDDAVRLDTYRRTNSVRHAVVVGGGFVGVEVAESLHMRGIRTSVVQPSPGPLHRNVGGQLSRQITSVLEANGIVVREDRMSGLQFSQNGHVSAVETAAGERIGCDLVVLALGTQPNVELGKASGVRIGKRGGFRVDEGMRTSLANVWACGDCVEVERVIDKQNVLSPLSLTAFRTGRVAGRNAARKGSGAPVRYPGVVGAQGLKLFDREIAYVGLTLDDALDAGFTAASVSIEHLTRSSLSPGSEPIHVTLVFDRARGRLLGAQLLGGNGTVLRADILIPLIRSGSSVQDLYDLDLIYSPSFSPRLDPLLVAAKKAMDDLQKR